MNNIEELEEKLLFLEEEIKKTEDYLNHQKYIAARYQNKIQEIKKLV